MHQIYTILAGVCQLILDKIIKKPHYIAIPKQFCNVNWNFYNSDVKIIYKTIPHVWNMQEHCKVHHSTFGYAKSISNVHFGDRR